MKEEIKIRLKLLESMLSAAKSAAELIDEEEEDNDDDDESGCEECSCKENMKPHAYAVDLMNIQNWAFGKDAELGTEKRAKKFFKEQHPDLDIDWDHIQKQPPQIRGILLYVQLAKHYFKDKVKE